MTQALANSTHCPDSVEAWLTLCRAPGLGGRGVRRLIERFGGVAAACRASEAGLRECGLSALTVAAIRNPDRKLRRLDRAWLSGVGHGLVALDDPAYPPLLRSIDEPPPLLFTVGDVALLKIPQVAVVGTRRPSHTGLSIAGELAAGLCAADFAVDSGLALGIDAAAHAAALDAGGRTVAVLGCGIDRSYPSRNRDLRTRIEVEGLVVSEFPPGTPPAAKNFPRRNRIISGLSLGVVVVEAARRSGSLITARLAAEQGRDVFAVPGSIRNPMTAGCHWLLRDGAALVETVDDILAELQPGLLTGPTARASGPETGIPGADDDAARVLESIGYEAVSVDALLQRTTLTPPALSSILLALELAGAVVVRPGGQYERAARPRR